MSVQKLVISPAPHVHGSNDTRRMMGDVLIALLPALVMSVVAYGWQAFIVTAFSVACCVLLEWAIQKFMLKGPSTIGNLSAVVTGVLLAFNLPVGIPLGLVAIGAVVAIGVAKMTYGGLGKNLFNPALVGRVFLLIAFPVAMTSFPEAVGAVSGATPLAMAKEALKAGAPVSEVMQSVNLGAMSLGMKSGSLGELSVVALLLGFVWLLVRRVISWHIPVVVLGTMALFAGIMWGISPEEYMSPVFHLLSGGAVLGAVFMATDYVTSPMTTKGMVIYAVGIGVITMLIRLWGPYPEGMSFAILIMNSVVPLIDKYVRPKRFGTTKRVAK
ncbi:MAG: RnfABCDGE type electron transport complex subunit D [Tidjanibacter sp.]|nr:RnfABCDGE type electron transport complex subunit D [Tidjanibacter sp.]